MKWPYNYIAIEGNIGAGKTTLAQELSRITQSKFLPERFEENPFLEDFYKDISTYGLQTELFFLHDRYSQIKNAFQDFRHSIVADFTFFKTKAFASVSLDTESLKGFNEKYNELKLLLPKPDLILHLKNDVEVYQKGIQNRGRLYEQQIENDYLHCVEKAYEELWNAHPDLNILIIDTKKIEFPYTSRNLSHLLEYLISTEIKGVKYF